MSATQSGKEFLDNNSNSTSPMSLATVKSSAMSYTVKQTVVSGHTFSISNRYDFTNCRILGRGSYGVVSQAIDTLTKQRLAIKRIRPYANDEWDGRHTLREIRLMKLLSNHPNVITLYELSLYQEKMELYMVMELMDCDLHHIIQSKQALTEMHYKCFARQILEGLKAMHSIGVFHRDLKPGNLLVSKDCQLRITDFGLARYMDEETLKGNNESNPQTEYVVTRWYRCPELLLSPNRPYSSAIDLWSVGCIMAELIRRKPLFPGKSHANQVQLIFEVLGYSHPSELGFTVSSEAASFLNKRCKSTGQDLWDVIPEASEEAICFIAALLDVNPRHRPTAAQALDLPYMMDADIVCDYTHAHCEPPKPGMFRFETLKMSTDELKELIHSEVFTSSSPRDDEAEDAPPAIDESLVAQALLSSHHHSNASSSSNQTNAAAAAGVAEMDSARLNNNNSTSINSNRQQQEPSSARETTSADVMQPNSGRSSSVEDASNKQQQQPKSAAKTAMNIFGRSGAVQSFATFAMNAVAGDRKSTPRVGAAASSTMATSNNKSNSGNDNMITPRASDVSAALVPVSNDSSNNSGALGNEAAPAVMMGADLSEAELRQLTQRLNNNNNTTTSYYSAQAPAAVVHDSFSSKYAGPLAASQSTQEAPTVARVIGPHNTHFSTTSASSTNNNRYASTNGSGFIPSHSEKGIQYVPTPEPQDFSLPGNSSTATNIKNNNSAALPSLLPRRDAKTLIMQQQQQQFHPSNAAGVTIGGSGSINSSSVNSFTTTKSNSNSQGNLAALMEEVEEDSLRDSSGSGVGGTTAYYESSSTAVEQQQCKEKDRLLTTAGTADSNGWFAKKAPLSSSSYAASTSQPLQLQQPGSAVDVNQSVAEKSRFSMRGLKSSSNGNAAAMIAPSSSGSETEDRNSLSFLQSFRSKLQPSSSTSSSSNGRVLSDQQSTSNNSGSGGGNTETDTLPSMSSNSNMTSSTSSRNGGGSGAALPLLQRPLRSMFSGLTTTLTSSGGISSSAPSHTTKDRTSSNNGGRITSGNYDVNSSSYANSSNTSQRSALPATVDDVLPFIAELTDASPDQSSSAIDTGSTARVINSGDSTAVTYVEKKTLVKELPKIPAYSSSQQNNSNNNNNTSPPSRLQLLQQQQQDLLLEEMTSSSTKSALIDNNSHLKSNRVLADPIDSSALSSFSNNANKNMAWTGTDAYLSSSQRTDPLALTSNNTNNISAKAVLRPLTDRPSDGSRSSRGSAKKQHPINSVNGNMGSQSARDSHHHSTFSPSQYSGNAGGSVNSGGSSRNNSDILRSGGVGPTSAPATYNSSGDNVTTAAGDSTNPNDDHLAKLLKGFELVERQEHNTSTAATILPSLNNR